MNKILFIAVGGALGSILRYFMSGFFYKYSDGVFPWGTLMVNLIGSFTIGFLWAVFENLVVSINLRSFILVGFLGAFTTFSTFTLENFTLIRESEIKLAVLNVTLSNILGICLVFIGYFLAKGILVVFK